MSDHILKVNHAGVMSIERISDNSLVLTPLSGRLIAKVFSTSMMMVERSRAMRRIMRRGKGIKSYQFLMYILLTNDCNMVLHALFTSCLYDDKNLLSCRSFAELIFESCGGNIREVYPQLAPSTLFTDLIQAPMLASLPEVMKVGVGHTVR